MGNIINAVAVLLTHTGIADATTEGGSTREGGSHGPQYLHRAGFDFTKYRL